MWVMWPACFQTFPWHMEQPIKMPTRRSSCLKWIKFKFKEEEPLEILKCKRVWSRWWLQWTHRKKNRLSVKKMNKTERNPVAFSHSQCRPWHYCGNDNGEEIGLARMWRCNKMGKSLLSKHLWCKRYCEMHYSPSIHNLGLSTPGRYLQAVM